MNEEWALGDDGQEVSHFSPQLAQRGHERLLLIEDLGIANEADGGGELRFLEGGCDTTHGSRAGARHLPLKHILCQSVPLKWYIIFMMALDLFMAIADSLSIYTRGQGILEAST